MTFIASPQSKRSKNARLTSVLEDLDASLDKVEPRLVEEGLAGVGGPEGALVDRLLAVHGVQPQLQVLL